MQPAHCGDKCAKRRLSAINFATRRRCAQFSFMEGLIKSRARWREFAAFDGANIGAQGASNRFAPAHKIVHESFRFAACQSQHVV